MSVWRVKYGQNASDNRRNEIIVLIIVVIIIIRLRYYCAYCTKVRLRHWSTIRQRRFQSSTRNNRAKVIIVHIIYYYSGYSRARPITLAHRINDIAALGLRIQWTLRTSLYTLLTCILPLPLTHVRTCAYALVSQYRIYINM